MVKAIPDGYHSITPYLLVQDVPKLIDFVKDAFGAEELMRMDGPDGKVAHAEVKIGDSIVMMGDPGQSQPATILIYTEGVDDVYQRALRAGAKSDMAPEDRFYGDRAASVKDDFGNTWYIHTHIEDLTPEEMEKRQGAMAPA